MSVKDYWPFKLLVPESVPLVNGWVTRCVIGAGGKLQFGTSPFCVRMPWDKRRFLLMCILGGSGDGS